MNQTDEMEAVEVFLVPGFLGFDAVASLRYFEGVVELLERKLARHGLRARVIPTRTLPTGSIAKRARQLAEELVAHHDPECDSVHLLGHSTGGLDIRLLLSPGSLFEPGGAIESLVAEQHAPRGDGPHVKERYTHALSSVRSAMSLATPHYGTPAAELLLRIGFDRILRELSGLQSPRGRRYLGSGIRLGGALADALLAIGVCPGFLAWMNEAVLSRPPEGVLDYLGALGQDLGALRNLSLEAASLFNASVVARPGVEYVSFCTATDKPQGLIDTEDPLVAINTLIFRALWPYVGRGNPGYPYATPESVAEMGAIYERDVSSGYDVGRLALGSESNDGLVPTSSQIYGRVGAVVASDHLDCIGMFQDGVRTGWIRSGASFNRARFELLWGRVADTVRDAHAASRGQGAAVFERPGAQLANSMTEPVPMIQARM